jgi:tRNA A-37 threonylcarbamoyl transferase component Bud32
LVIMSWSAAWKWRSARIDRTTLEVRASGVAFKRASDQKSSPHHGKDVVSSDSREEAARVADRLSTWAWLGTALSAVGGCVAVVTLRGYAPHATWLGQFALVQLSGAAVFAAIGAYVRGIRARGMWPTGADVALTVSTTLVLLASSWPAPRELRPDLIAILAIGQLLVLRAALVPSAPRRALWLGVACTAPIVPFTYLYYASRLEAGADPGPGVYAWYSAAFAASIVLVSSLVSRNMQRGREAIGQLRQLGQYVLVRRIGGGGMGVVYEAEHQTLRRQTAIKVLRPEKTAEHNLVRFEREARLTASLCHPNTVSVYDYGRTPGGTFYYAMEYIEGIDLDMLVQHDGPQHPGRVIQILSQICGSLSEAHAVGLIHQDIKPANVFLCERAGMVDMVKVLDFGLVRRFSRSESAEGRTSMIVPQQQDFVGTPHYVAPEALLGDGEVDGRTDLYSLGCVAHYLLTGSAPFAGNTVLEVLGQHLHAKAKPFAAKARWPISAELERLILGCLGKARVQRPSDAATLYALLQQCPEARAWDAEHGRKWWAERGTALKARVAAARAAEAAS